MYKFFIYVILFLLFNLSFISCNSDKNNITFSGIVSDMSDSKQIANVKVSLYASNVDNGNTNLQLKLINETYTDEQGKYNINCKLDTYIKFCLKFDSQNYFISELNFEPSNGTQNYIKDISMAKMSFLKIIVRKATSQAVSSVKVKVEGINPKCNSCCASDYKIFDVSTNHADQKYFCNVVGGDNVKIIAIINYANTSDIKEYNQFCTPQDTSLCVVYY